MRRRDPGGRAPVGCSGTRRLGRHSASCPGPRLRGRGTTAGRRTRSCRRTARVSRRTRSPRSTRRRASTRSVAARRWSCCLAMGRSGALRGSPDRRARARFPVRDRRARRRQSDMASRAAGSPPARTRQCRAGPQPRRTPDRSGSTLPVGSIVGRATRPPQADAGRPRRPVDTRQACRSCACPRATSWARWPNRPSVAARSGIAGRPIRRSRPGRGRRRPASSNPRTSRRSRPSGTRRRGSGPCPRRRPGRASSRTSRGQ